MAPDLIVEAAVQPNEDLGSAVLLPSPVAQTASGASWVNRKASDSDVAFIVSNAKIDRLLARILASRGVSPDGAVQYLNPKLRDILPDPYVLCDMEKATAIIVEAIRAKKKIGVFGDYDVDGTSAASILKLYFDAIGVDIRVHLPDRFTEGYGPSAAGFGVLVEQGVELVLTVDCGSSSDELFAEFKAKGASSIVFDHHLIQGSPPASAAAVVNPNAPGDKSGLKNLSAAGVVFLAIIALNRVLRSKGFFEERPEPDTLKYLDLAALGLVADVMEMSGVTRAIVAQGLKKLRINGNPGLVALGEAAGAKELQSTYDLGFVLGPRINAAGRIGHAQLAFELLTTDDGDKRHALALKLDDLNKQRRAIEQQVCEEAIAKIENERLADNGVIVVANNNWHAGVVGIVAGRIKERFDRPAVVIAIENGIGKGSARSIENIDLGSVISNAYAQGILIAGGGHAMAAGLTIDADKVSQLRDYLNDELTLKIDDARVNRKIEIDGVISPAAITASFAELISSAGPFGPGNPEPVFALLNVRSVHSKIVGNDHIAATLSSPDGMQFRAISFRSANSPLGEMLVRGKHIHVAGRVTKDDWRGGNAGQFQIVDAAVAN
ncbi:MAG: single-stranded-DNA-specific exonuclease RecJ [Marinicaulis sp.]|nr:single-stranded-DNA-specific exonuclease RecJ [Marinicaulis sp.]NNE41050.1 single-stranded-DNA-specific exonuclease RecJ [Marinicaulis sp.]